MNNKIKNIALVLLVISSLGFQQFFFTIHNHSPKKNRAELVKTDHEHHENGECNICSVINTNHNFIKVDSHFFKSIKAEKNKIISHQEFSSSISISLLNPRSPPNIF